MSDSEKLDLIISDMREMRAEIASISLTIDIQRIAEGKTIASKEQKQSMKSDEVIRLFSKRIALLEENVEDIKKKIS